MRHVLFLLLMPALLTAQTTNVLFIGNSYTYANDLPGTLESLALSLGDTLACTSSTFGGATLGGHATNAATLDLIAQGGWDFVILQEQSQLPSFPDSQVNADFFPAVHTLVEAIRAANPCAMPVLFMTWGRENGDASNCANWPPVCTYEGMQALLTERYLEASVAEEAWCAPVGVVWSNVIGAVDLYSGDGSHPSAAGTYLAAATFYAALTGQDPTEATFDAGLAEAAALREAAWTTFTEQPAAWNRFDPLGYEMTWDAGQIHFTTGPLIDSLSLNGSPFPSGSPWTIPGATPVELTLHSSCAGDLTVLDTVFADVAGLPELAALLAPFPNPAAQRFSLDLPTACTVRLFSASGALHREWAAPAGRSTWFVGDVPRGVWLLEVDGRWVHRLVIAR